MAIKKQAVKALFTIAICFWTLAALAQGTFVYRNGAEVTTESLSKKGGVGHPG
jgi:hypothetical protein